MKKELEDYLWNEIEKYGPCTPVARDVIEHMIKTGMISTHKEALKTLEKWTDNGTYNWGCKLDLGWKEHKIVDNSLGET